MTNKGNMAQRPTGRPTSVPSKRASKATSRSGSSRSTPTDRRPRTRRVVYLVMLLLLVAAAVAVNREPVFDLMHAKATWTQKAEALAAAREDVEAARAEVDSLASPSRMEVKARENLGYVRPGEEMFIVQGGDHLQSSSSAVEGDRPDATEEPQGLLERIVNSIRGVFARTVE